MGNCLVTKLKGAVSGSLEKLGELKVTVKELPAADYNADVSLLRIAVGSGKSYTIRTTGDGYFAESFEDLSDPAKRKTTETYTFTPSTIAPSLYFVNGNYDVYVSNKYDITVLMNYNDYITNSLFALNIDELAYTVFGTSLTFNSKRENMIVGNIKSLNDKSFTQCSLYYTDIVGAVGDISGISGIIQTFGIPKKVTGTTGEIGALNVNPRVLNLSDHISGSIENLSTMTDLAAIEINGSQIDGTVEGFVQGQIQNGRSTCDGIDIKKLLSMVSFGGNVYTTETSNNILAWESASKITVYYGAASKASCPKIYAKGATAEEIAAWEQAGKTVVVIS